MTYRPGLRGRWLGLRKSCRWDPSLASHPRREAGGPILPRTIGWSSGQFQNHHRELQGRATLWKTRTKNRRAEEEVAVREEEGPE